MPASLASAALAYVAVMGGYVWYASSRERELSRATRERTELADRVGRLDAVRKKQAEFELKRAQLRHELAVVDSMVPRDAALESLRRAFAELARAQSLPLQRTSAKAEVAKDAHVEIPVELEASGSLDGMLAFLVKLQRLPRLLSLGDVRIEHVEAQRYRLVATVIAYRSTAKP